MQNMVGSSGKNFNYSKQEMEADYALQRFGLLKKTKIIAFYLPKNNIYMEKTNQCIEIDFCQ
jgi:hypothetical protein